MLSNSEFAVYNHVPTELGEDMADFAMFSLDMGDYKENKKIAFPHLQGKGNNLWDITPIRESPIHDRGVEKKSVEQTKELARLENLNRYISQGFAFDPIARDHTSEDDGIGKGETPQDEGNEWDRFFAVDTQPTGGKFRQKGRVKNLSSFEQFVDNSQ